MREILVLGLGNVLLSDEGFGVRCVEALRQRFHFSPEIRLVDGGTRGIGLLEEMEGAEKLLLFDATDFGMKPGSLCYLNANEIPHYIAAGKLSLHQTGFQDVLAFGQITGVLPQEIQIIGVQPESLEYGLQLSPCVETQLPAALALALAVLERWGAAAGLAVTAS